MNFLSFSQYNKGPWVTAFGYLRMLSMTSSLCHLVIFFCDTIYVCAMDINILSIIKPTKMIEKYMYLFISILLGWLPAFCIASYPLISPNTFYMFNFNSFSILVDGDLKVFTGLRVAMVYLPMVLLCVQISYCFWHVYVDEKEEVFVKSESIRQPVLWASATYAVITSLSLIVEGRVSVMISRLTLVGHSIVNFSRYENFKRKCQIFKNLQLSDRQGEERDII